LSFGELIIIEFFAGKLNELAQLHDGTSILQVSCAHDPF